MAVIAEQDLDIADSAAKMAVRIFAPEQRDLSTWGCRCEVGEPVAEVIETDGVSSLQALALAIQELAAALYSTELYRSGQLGAFVAFDGYLGIPAPSSFKNIAPHTF
ncbi:DUF6968 family protein [Phenylobacterium sp.]|uniref:DUF6968 family protein n=1 Tax=Phenylobacterium sp. TaxID=1871053 RepID=UPI00286D97E2|nr:hypothetical protein [Phenylobacterium sp.]